MFTGIIEAIGEIKNIRHGAKSAELQVACSSIMEGVSLGDSIAVNGVCLTARDIRPDGFTADVMAETLRRSSLGELKVGSRVNLERAMQLGGRFGGHIVSGHIDGTGTVTGFQREDVAVWVKISAPPRIMRYIIEKGSVALDGVSLTVAKVDADSFQVSLIPHTAKETILLEKKVGSLINIENDIVGKYVEKLLTPGNVGGEGAQDKEASSAGQGSPGLSMEFLAEHGFL